MTNNREKLSGIFAPVVTPFKNDELSLDDLRFNLKKLARTPLTGYLALGSNGEFKSLTASEEMQVLEVFAKEKADKIIMVGTGCESTRETIAKSKAVAAMGFDFVSVLTPHYFGKRMDGPTLKGYYERIADSSPIPVLLYNAPGFAGGVQIPANVVVELSNHPNIAGMKDSSSTGPAKFLSLCGDNDSFSILAGSANFLYPSLHLGSPGGIVSLANALPEPCAAMYGLFLEGKFDEARDLHFRLARLNDAISGSYGVAGVKAAMDICGYRGGEPRHPLIPVDGSARDKIRSTIEGQGFSL